MGSSNKNNAEQGHAITSLRQHTLRYTFIIFVVIFFAAVIHYLVFSQYLHSLDHREYQESLERTAQNISRSVNFYQLLINRMAAQPKVADMLNFANKHQAQSWAVDMQAIVPDVIGMALFDKQHKLLGDSEKLRLSQSCLGDMQKRLQGIPTAQPPVHHRIIGLEHYDVIAPVHQDGEYVGMLFSSFSLEVIERLLDDLAAENLRYRVVNSTGYMIAETSGFNGEIIDIYKTVIPETDWYIEMAVLSSRENALVTSLLVSNFVTFILVSGILYFSMSRLFHVVLQDFDTLGWLIGRIRSGSQQDENPPVTRLKETEGVMRFIQYCTEEIGRYQRKLEQESTTDELTGLYNRRVLNQYLEKFLDLANHDHTSYLVIIDIDLFKEINDTYGHDVGDKVLLYFSEVFKKNCREADVCTRAGGDEFIALLVDYSKQDIESWYHELCRKMWERIDQYNLDTNYEIKFGLSAGCTLIRNNDLKSAVLKRADEALYKVKASGRNSIQCL